MKCRSFPFYKMISGVLLLSLITILNLKAQDTAISSVESALKKANALTHQGEDSAALLVYRQVLQKKSDEKTALAYSSILLSRRGERLSGEKAKVNFQEALYSAQKALKSDSSYAPSFYAYALSTYHLSLSKKVKDKIRGLREVKKSLDQAVVLDPSFALSWYLLGRWNMAFDHLGFAEKAAVKVLFGGMPDAGAKQAVSHFEKSKELNPSFIKNYYYWAKALHADGKDLQAIEVLKKAIHLRPILKGDREIQKDCRKMIDHLM